jgi:NADH-quinone oxidoreductase subunit L
MHGNADEGDIRKLGGLRKQMRITWACFAIATVAITGVFPLSGFFSKDAILHGLHTTELEAFPHVLHYVWFLGLASALCTAFYMTRLYVMTFEGTRAPDARIPHAHESAPAMTGVLVILAILSVVALVHGLPIMSEHPGGPLNQTVMENFLQPVFATARSLVARTHVMKLEVEEGLPWNAWLTAWAIAITGAGAAAYVYTKVLKRDQPLTGFMATLQKLSYDKFYFDEIYDFLIVKPVKFISFVSFKVIDSMLIDTVAVRGTAWLTVRVGSVLRYIQSGDAQGYAAVMALALAAGLAWALLMVLK